MAILKLETNVEHVILFLATGLSNFPIIPTLVYNMSMQSYFHSFTGWFTMFISFFYHCTEALPSQRWILNEGNWHRLDNVGSITSFTLLMIYLMDISHYPNLRAFFELSQFGITLIIQERGPWNLENTVVPIAFWFAVCVIKHVGNYFIYGKPPNFNWRPFKIGWSIMLIAFVFFYKGLDDANDYLRLYHSGWHLCVTISQWWIWQIVKAETPPKQKGKNKTDVVVNKQS